MKASNKLPNTQTISFADFFADEIALVYYFAVIISSIGWGISIITNSQNLSIVNHIANLTFSFPIFVTVLFSFKNKIAIQNAFIILVLCAFFAQITEHITSINLASQKFIIYRDLFTMPLFLLGISFINTRKTLYFFVTFYAAYIIFISYYSDIPSLIHDLPYFILILISYTIGLEFFLSSMLVILQKNKIFKEQIEAQNIELEKINIQNNKLFSIIAHDLKGPIGTTTNLLEIVNDFDQENDNKKLLSSAFKTIKNANFLLENLLIWGKNRVQYSKENTSLVNINEEIETIILMNDGSIQIKEIEIYFNSEKMVDFKTNKELLLTILRNLISNAIKFTPQKGYINIQVTDQEKSILFCTQNPGVGLTLDQIHSVLSKNQFHSTKGTNSESGSGLGLKLVKEFTEIMGGQLTIESIPNESTRIEITLPKVD